MTFRAFDASIINRIAADPQVHRAMGLDPDDPPMTFDQFVGDPDHFIILDNRDDAAMIAEWRGPGIWEAHSMTLPTCRGADAFKMGVAMLTEMFTQHGADIVWAQTPHFNLPQRGFNRKLGAKSMGHGRNHVLDCDVEFFRFDKAEWLAQFNNAKSPSDSVILVDGKRNLEGSV